MTDAISSILSQIRAHETRMRDIATDAATGIDADSATTDKPAYRLLRPVTLGAHFSQPRFRVAMDDMTARPVSLALKVTK